MQKNKEMAIALFSVFFTLPFTSHATDHDANKGKEKEACCHGWFDKMDTNHDGKISKEEFLKWQEERFNRMDANHDGVIDKKEAETIRDQMKANMKKLRDEVEEGTMGTMFGDHGKK